MESQLPMAVFRTQLQSLRTVVFSWIILLLARSVDGGQIFYVGNEQGWNSEAANDSNPSNYYQNWADQENFTVTDSLDFGPTTMEYFVDNEVRVMSWEEEDICNTSAGEIVNPDPNVPRIRYNFTRPGQFGFINGVNNYCAIWSMKFKVTVYAQDGQPGSNASMMNTEEKQHSFSVGLIVGVVTGVAVVLIALIAIMVLLTRKSYWHRLKKNSHSSVDLSYISDSGDLSHSSYGKDVEVVGKEWPLGPQRFTYSELKVATQSFDSSLVIGEGGFGTVYKGYLRDSPNTPVAVKKLSQYARQGAREFTAEVNIISQLRHRNLVQLLGWCDETEELILVYEFMPRGDLDDLIFGGYHGDEGPEFTPLPWKCRYNIFRGVATALVYLHEEWEQRVVHRDVKTANVMLDHHFNARLGDFGLARLSAHSQAPRTTQVAGTIGYLAPEFSLTGRATDKTDVYAFGVVVLEVSCARRPLTENCILVDWVWNLYKEEKLLDAIDPKLDSKSVEDEEDMKQALQVGLLCCHPDPGARPTMRHVLNILSGETPLPKLPRSQPVAFFAERR